MNNMPVIEANVETTDLHEHKYLTFNIDKEEYGIAIQYVIQIFGIRFLYVSAVPKHILAGVTRRTRCYNPARKPLRRQHRQSARMVNMCMRK